MSCGCGDYKYKFCTKIPNNSIIVDVGIGNQDLSAITDVVVHLQRGKDVVHKIDGIEDIERLLDQKMIACDTIGHPHMDYQTHLLHEWTEEELAEIIKTMRGTRMEGEEASHNEGYTYDNLTRKQLIYRECFPTTTK
jgi:hypothetical protein